MADDGVDLGGDEGEGGNPALALAEPVDQRHLGRVAVEGPALALGQLAEGAAVDLRDGCGVGSPFTTDQHGVSS
ncbi:hypothetical protein DFR74_105106 [Nocardia puris]|uniref:Uncharacterized protein n=1 Tax=Nocardia puris TaxID=208602 RepID=A0A366DN24_9NOCA|nr:hypothetical protein DFR74_105106 [Nocardia puris]